MKHIFIYLSLLIAVALTSCQKEDDLSNEIDFSNIYAINCPTYFVSVIYYCSS